MRTLEAKVERDVKRWCDKHKEDVLWFKFVVPGMSGVPDRIALLRGGRVLFVELKRPGAKPRKLQEWVHRKMRALGFRVCVFDNADECIARLHDELYTDNT